MSQRYPLPQDDAPLVVFDFDHTLYDGDSGSHLFKWLIERHWWRVLLALLVAPVAGPMVAWLPTRRAGISVFVWVGTLGVRDRAALDALIDRYVVIHAEAIKARLLPLALDVFHQHRARGDMVLVATGAPPELARAILDFVAHQDLPVVGSLGRRFLGGYVTAQHCHAENKLRMLRTLGYDAIDIAYSDSTADLPLLRAARQPVVVNPKASRVEYFRKVLPATTPILNWGCKSRSGDPG